MSNFSPAATPPASLPTSLGRYTLEEQVGSGAMGVVYRATLHGPAGFRKRLAVKLIPGGPSSKLVSEARLGALLDHPNLVEVYDLAYEAPWWLIAMEWVQGSTLLSLLQRRGAMPGRAVQQVGAQLTSALSHAHELEVEGRPHPIVHRDLKPSNVLLTPGAVVKLADLGLAVLAGTAPDESGGTPGYMAPEQVEAHGPVDPRTDQFALGVLLAEMTLGQRLVRSEPGDDVLRRHERLYEALAQGDLQQRIDEAFGGLGAVVERCLQPTPDDRFATCIALGEALAELPATGSSLVEWATEEPEAESEALVSSSQRRPSRSSGREPVVGRRADLERLDDALQGAMVVAVQGPGGVGKSKLVLHHAARTARQYSGGTWVCDLEAVQEVPAVCVAMATTLGLPLGPGSKASVVSQIGHQLRALGSTLVVLDHADEALDAVREVLWVWQAIAQEARFVVASRSTLQLEGARRMRLEPLATAEAVGLLRDRALRAGANEAWTDAAAEIKLVELAEQLDGLPLALELAATHAGTHTPDEVMARMADGPPDPLERVVRTSWAQLSTEEQRGLGQLSVFRGGFTIEDAERIVQRTPEGTWVTDLVERLLNRSMLMVRQPTFRQPRFRLFESVRQFASKQLNDPKPLALRHARWFARVGSAVNGLTPPQDPLRERQAADLENFIAGIDAGIEFDDLTAAAGCAVAAGRVLHDRGPARRGLDLVERVLTLADGHAALLETAARLAHRTDDPRALGWAEDAVRIGSDARENVLARLTLGLILTHLGRKEEGRLRCEEARDLAYVLGDPGMEGWSALMLGRLLIEHDTAARGLLGYALSVGRLTQHREMTVLALVSLGRLSIVVDEQARAQRQLEQAIEAGQGMPIALAEAYRSLGETTEEPSAARTHVEAALKVYRRLGMRRRENVTRTALARLDMQQGDYLSAREQLEMALTIAEEIHYQEGVSFVVLNLAEVRWQMGEVNAAVEAFTKSLDLLAAAGKPWQHPMAELNLAQLDLERDRPHEALARVEATRPAIEALGPMQRPVRVFASIIESNAHHTLGEPDQAKAKALQAVGEGTKLPMLSAWAHVEAARAWSSEGNQVAAQEHFAQAEALATSSSDRWLAAYVAMRRADLEWDRGDLDNAATTLNTLLATSPHALRGLRAHASGLRALIERERGGPSSSPDAVQAAIERLRKLGMETRARRLHEVLTAPAQSRS
ncbi:MAG: protein kinase [Myxococcota bacterium]